MPDPVPSRYGVLLLNMGGPSGPEEVEPFIFRLLADPNMLRLPLGWLWQRPLARMIARARAKKVQKRYGLIGGSSPLEPITVKQVRLLEQELGAPVAYAMRYTRPTASEALQKLASKGSTRFVAIPLYPQYSTVSTLSTVQDLQAQARGAQIHIIDRHSENVEYVTAMRELLKAELEKTDPSLKTHVLFTAHSIPEAYIRSGDPYAKEIEHSAADVIGGIPGAPPYSLAYQSQVGPVKWRGPTLEDELSRLVSTGVEQIVAQPLSFVAENLETQYDLDIVFKQQCEAAGIRSFFRVPALNDSPKYISALASMAREVISQWEAGGA